MRRTLRFIAIAASLAISVAFQPCPVKTESKVLGRTALGATVDAAGPKPKKSTEEKWTKEALELAEVFEANEPASLFEAKDKDTKKLLIAQIAPSVRVGVPELFGLRPGEITTGQLVASLKELGFDLVFDTNVAADLTIMEEGTELLHRIKARLKDDDTATLENPKQLKEPLPLFTSCCPGWMAFVEKSEPELASYISTCKSPHMMFGAFVKEFSQAILERAPEDVYFCSIMPCVRKRGESDREVFIHNGIREVDNVITVKDLGMMLRKKGIDPSQLEDMEFDSPFQLDGTGSGAGQLFGATGGVMEAAVRTVYELVTGQALPRMELDPVRGLDGVKSAVLPLYGENLPKEGLPIDLRVAVCSGLGNAKKLIKQMRSGEVEFDFVEVMACPGGCINGGGQPKGDSEAIKERLEYTYELDRKLPRRKSHENEVVGRMYNTRIL